MTPRSTTDDEDGDGCTDYKELGDDETLGGDRDPFNPYDYLDIDHNGAVNVVVDILGVSSAFGTGHPRYVDYKDRSDMAGFGPNAWNLLGPDGNINTVTDIIGVSRQMGHNCPHPVKQPITTALGPHPTTLSAKVTAEQPPPFAMSVNTTAAYAKSGQLLVDAETLSYDQNDAGCSGLIPATQFCITARGNGTPTGNDPAQHAVDAIVYQKP